MFFYRNLQFLSDVIIIKTKALLPQAQVTSDDFWLSSLGPLVFIAPIDFYIIWPTHVLNMNVPYESYYRNVSYALNYISLEISN